MEIKEVLKSRDWKIVDTLFTDEFEKQLFPFEDLPLSVESQTYLTKVVPDGLYLHQKEAIASYLDGLNVCLTTRTASGKSLAFYTAGIEEIVRNPSAKIIAVYPMRALGSEQEERWKNALNLAGVKAKVGRIDGSVKPLSRRPAILKECQVITCTLDIIHAWFLSHLNDKYVQNFLRSLSLIIVDEVHTYTGVFGSNSAFLFRRLRHLMALVGTSPRFIGASATISDPEKHLQKLFGFDFVVIGEEFDTSPKHQLEIHLVNLPGTADFLTEIVNLLKGLVTETESRFITFVDSRKQVELISSILARGRDREDDKSTEEETKQPDDYELLDGRGFDSSILDNLDVLPYRAGYEEFDRRIIQHRLSTEELNGVISTSGLELGIDIPHLDTCILVGVPRSATSLFQRIGRVGRKSNGYVIVINTGDVYNEAIFADPGSFLKRPLAESAMYLENQYIQYIHALCLSRLDGEHDQIANTKGYEDSEFTSPIRWPDQFIELCNKERSGQVPKLLQSMKAESGDIPNYTYPLRDIESQFQVEYKSGHQRDQLGSLGYDQVMREAYPGAIYYYATQPYRVYQVNRRSKQIYVRKVKRYTTSPQKLPTLVFPNLNGENVLASASLGDLIIVECDLQIRETINGFKERRGPNESIYSYPLSGDLGFYFDQSYFTRNYFTTGIVLTHPILNNPLVNYRLIAELFYEAFLISIPFERQDINFAADKHRTPREPLIHRGDNFIAIYDQTYGSLRLTSRIMEERAIPHIMNYAKELVNSQNIWVVNRETLEALDIMIEAASQHPAELIFDSGESVNVALESADFERIILPGSKGLNLNRDNEEFFVDRVFLHPQGLCYEGVTETLANNTNLTCLPFVKDIIEIPGVSEIGLYNYNTGEIEELKFSLGVKTVPTRKAKTQKEIDLEKLRFVLTAHFNENELKELCEGINLNYSSIDGIEKKVKVNNIIAYCEEKQLTIKLLTDAFHLSKRKLEESR